MNMKKNLLFKTVVFGSFLLFSLKNVVAQQNIIVDIKQYQQMKISGNLLRL
jgi:hypothetical protein